MVSLYGIIFLSYFMVSSYGIILWYYRMVSSYGIIFNNIVFINVLTNMIFIIVFNNSIFNIIVSYNNISKNVPTSGFINLVMITVDLASFRAKSNVIIIRLMNPS